MSDPRSKSDEKDPKSEPDEKKEKKSKDKTDSETELFRVRPLTRHAAQKQKIIAENTPFPEPLVRIVHSYSEDTVPGKETNILMMAKDLLSSCYLEEFKLLARDNKIPYRYNPLIVILESTSEHATPQSKFEFMEYLVENGFAKPKFIDDLSPQGRMSPLMLASQQGNAPVVELLLDHDADIYHPWSEIRDRGKGWKAIDYAMKELLSRPEGKTEDSPFKDYEKCVKLILQQCFIAGKAYHKEHDLIMIRWKIDKTTHPNAYAMKKCFSSMNFKDVEAGLKSQLPIADFFIQQLDKARVSCEKRRSLFPADRSGIEIIDALKRKMVEQKTSFKDAQQFYNFLEKELRNDPKLNAHYLQKSGGPLAKAIFMTEIYIRSETVALTREYDERLIAEARSKMKPGSGSA